MKVWVKRIKLPCWEKNFNAGFQCSPVIWTPTLNKPSFAKFAKVAQSRQQTEKKKLVFEAGNKFVTGQTSASQHPLGLDWEVQ